MCVIGVSIETSRQKLFHPYSLPSPICTYFKSLSDETYAVAADPSLVAIILAIIKYRPDASREAPSTIIPTRL